MRLIALALMFLTVSFPVYAQRPAAAKTSEHAALNARLQAINSRVTERNRVECRKLVADSGVIGGGKIEVTRTPTLNRRRSCVAMVHSNLNQAVYEVPIKITGANGATRPHQLLCAYWLTSGEIKVIVLSAASLAHAPSYSPCHTF